MSSPLPVVDTWFRTTIIDAQITRIDEPYVDELLRANAWHIRGAERDVFVDCGLGVGTPRSALPGLWTRDPILVLTHAHLDHMGSAHAFADCWAHPFERVEHPAPGSLQGPELAAELGLDETLPAWLISARPDERYDPAAYRLAPARVTRALLDGDTVELGDRSLTVLHLPGHSPGGLALLDEHDGTLFSGDIVYDDELLDDITGADRADYVQSMRRLRELPVRVVHPGHGPSFDGARLHQIIDTYLATRADPQRTS